MRILSVEVTGIGGLRDGEVNLPADPVVAIAGANGTGKSKLLAALLAPWTRVIPTPRNGVDAEATLRIQLTPEEQIAFKSLSLESQWGDFDCPEIIELGVKSSIAGTNPTATPLVTVLQNFIYSEIFLRTHRGLNLVYLPAERRLLPGNQGGIELDQLSEVVAYQKNSESRSSVQNFGRLDDQEFERFASALSIADQLPEDKDAPRTNNQGDEPLPRITWSEFQETINDLLYPKKLLPLSKYSSERLRILLPNGDTHHVPDLSSGERQALIIVSRVLRAGAGHSVVIIDEPDAYLHPQLSQRLITALARGIGEGGQLIVATHSPSILDNLPAKAILRISHDRPAAPVGTELDRIALYKETGFRASGLTQSDLLLYTEGDSDGDLLKSIYPKLVKASIKTGGGRNGVLQRIKSLADGDLPVLGVVDRDVSAPTFNDRKVAERMLVWPTADIEGIFLSDDLVLQLMIDEKLVTQAYRDINALRAKRDQLYLAMKDVVIAEVAKNELRGGDFLRWPNARANDPIEVLRSFAAGIAAPEQALIDAAVSKGEKVWSDNSHQPWVLVRGKYIIGDFNSQVGTMRTSTHLLEVIASNQPKLTGLKEFEAKLDEYI